jgi:DNA mismatch endonuclease (patch repair protein)
LPDVPGKSDIYLSGKRAIFVRGCFWHGHDCARGAHMPEATAAYWSDKIERNRYRDILVRGQLEQSGWRTLVVWECELKDEAKLTRRLKSYLEA